MTYVLIKNGVVVQKQPNAQEGFIQASDSVVCGYLYDGKSFNAPQPQQPVVAVSDIDIRLAALESKVGITPQDQLAAKSELIATATAELTSEPAQLSIKAG